MKNLVKSRNVEARCFLHVLELARRGTNTCWRKIQNFRDEPLFSGYNGKTFEMKLTFYYITQAAMIVLFYFESYYNFNNESRINHKQPLTEYTGE